MQKRMSWLAVLTAFLWLLVNPTALATHACCSGGQADHASHASPNAPAQPELHACCQVDLALAPAVQTDSSGFGPALAPARATP